MTGNRMTDLTLLLRAEDGTPISLQEHLQQTEARIRREPTAPEHRWALVEVLCILGHWDRALSQLQAWAKWMPQSQAQAHWVRGLIRAEAQRTEVFSGDMAPAPVTDMPDWMRDLAKAMAHNARAENQEADVLRSQALAQAPQRAGVCVWQGGKNGEQTMQEQAYEWMADSDTRLGPVCEVMVAGAYRWLAFADVAHLSLQAPQCLLDLVWMPAKLQLHSDAGLTPAATGRVLHVFLPTRYPIAANASESSATHDALLMSRLTRWREVGETGVFAQGQKTWMSDGIDWPLLDVRELRA
jgi:type VI secretion system protein ImpE